MLPLCLHLLQRDTQIIGSLLDLCLFFMPPVSAMSTAFSWERVLRWLRAFWPAPVAVDARERWRSVVGGAVGIGLTAWLGHTWLIDQPSHLWLLAPVGASAVLVFAVPASPLAQPWAVIGGNGLSALVGMACARWIGDPVLAAAAAVGLAIGVMFWLRCLHPPGGAMALSAVLSHWVGPSLTWEPLLLNTVGLVAAGVVYNTLTGRAYPHVQLKPPPSLALAQRAHFSSEDLDAALAHYNQVLDVSRDDLEGLLAHAEMAAYRRNLGALRCEDVMSRSPVAVLFNTPLSAAWKLLHQHRVKALPVVDKAQRLVGIVTLADLMRHAELEGEERFGQRLLEFMRRMGAGSTNTEELVGDVMTRQVRVSSADRPLIELVPLFSQEGHHHIPVIDAQARLIGIITQSDLVRALYRAVRVDA
jgi:CBS domain-containing membrane protein